MIDSLTVWHGPVFGLYGDAAREALDGLPQLVVSCSETSPNDLNRLAPEDSILAEDRNGVWLRGLHEWKADEVAKAVKFFDKHPLHYDIVITQDKVPVKAVTDVAHTIHDFQVPKNKRDYERQIDDWLLMRQRGMEKGVAAKLVDYCAPEPEVAQRVAVVLAGRAAGELITWDSVQPHVAELVEDKRPMWDLGKAIGTGKTNDVLFCMSVLDTKEPFVLLRYLENRYRMLLLASSGAALADIQQINPKANQWMVKKTLDECKGASPRLCSLAIMDIANAFELLMDNSRDSDGDIILEQCVMKLTARHNLSTKR